MLPVFKDPALLSQALTHSSYLNENHSGGRDNERLEFLGDAVLDFIAGAWLFERFPYLDEGRLTTLRAALVRVSTLATFSREIGLAEHLRLGKGELDSGGRERGNILGDAFEAVLGALYLDQGIDACRAFVIPFLERVAPGIALDQSDRDAKTQLQELSQGCLNITPSYRLVDTSGPDHAKVFAVEVLLGAEVYASGTAQTKRVAEQIAAREAMARLQAEIEAARAAAEAVVDITPEAGEDLPKLSS